MSAPMLPKGALEPSAWNNLDAVVDEIATCTRCALAQGRTHAVPGEGSRHPTIMFIGEGPGANEDEQGRPFVGRAGALLDELLADVPLRRQDVYITNVVKCRPPENRDPLPNEVAACWPYLEAQIALLNPRVIATLGRHSLTRFFPSARISDRHGKPMRWRERVVFPLYHPAAGLRSTRLRDALEADFRKLPQAVLAALQPVSSTETAPPRAAPPTRIAEERPESGDDDGRPQLSLF